MRLSAVPRPAPTGRLLVGAGEIRARVSIDGRAMAETPATIEGVLAGVRKVVVEAEGYLPWSGDVAIEEGRAAYVNVTLVRRPVVR